MAFCTAVALGQFLYYFLFGQYRSSGNDSLPGTILCMVAAGLVGYFVAEMLIKKSFRVFRAGAKGAVIVSLALVLLGVAMSFDLTGYEKRVPDESEIESAFYTFSGMTNVTTDDADTIRRLTAAPPGHRQKPERAGAHLQTHGTQIRSPRAIMPTSNLSPCA